MGIQTGNTNPSQATVMDWIAQVAAAFGVPAPLIYARADIESNFTQFDPQTGGVLTSSAGAVGIMQTIPRFVPASWGLDVANSWHDNVIAGVKELAGYYAQYHNWHDSFAAYAAGPGNIPGGQAAANHEFDVARTTYNWTGYNGNPNPNATFDPSKPGPTPGANQPPTAPGYVYRNPVRDLTTDPGMQSMFRVDQGVDYGGHGPVYAIGKGVVVKYDTSSTWVGGAYIAYKITEGPAAGRVVYLAENLTLNSSLHVGSKVDANTVLAQLHSAYPHSEMGWATSDGSEPLAKNTGGYVEGQRTWAGNDFNNFMVSVFGAPSGTITDANGNVRPIVGQAPTSWPTWNNVTPSGGNTPGGGNINIPNGTTPAELAGILRGFGVNPHAFHDLIDQAIRGQWSGPQFVSALYSSQEFKTMFPGIFRADGSLIMNPAQYNKFGDMYTQVARGMNITLDRARIGVLIHSDVSVGEFAQRMKVLAYAKSSEQFRASFNAQRKLGGKPPIPQGDWYDFIAGAAPATLYDEYEAAYLQSNGLDVNRLAAHHIATQFDERGSVADQASLSDLVKRVQQTQSLIAPELKANGITTADLALLQAGRDPHNLAPVLQQLLTNRQALAGRIPNPSTFGPSRTAALYPVAPQGL